MAVLPSSGPLSINDIASVMLDPATPYGMNEYYRGGGLVPSTKTVTTTEGPFGDLGPPSYYWRWWPGYVDIWWNTVQVYTGLTSATSITVGSYTYIRGYVFYDASNPEFGADYYSVVSRSSSTTVNINGSVPTSGQISISNFYGAEKP